ncbi:MAG TPA: hypothetical protein VK056_02675 [Bacillota bacterium]|nr:hypothetical protein [Bacillota bacterium]
MICPTCGTESALGKFCSNCGAELPPTEYDQSANETNEYEQPVHDEYGEQAYDPNDYEQQPAHDTGEYEEPSYDSYEHSTEYEQTADTRDNFEQPTYEADDVSEQTYPADSANDLFSESETETAATDATDDLFADESASAGSDQSNEIVDKTKEVASNFGNFFISYLKEPIKAINVTKDNLISSIITLSIFSFVIALNVFFMYRKIASIFNQGSFVDGFLLPFIGIIILFAIVIGVTFAGVSITHRSFSFTDTAAKLGALAVPFLTLYVLAFIISLMGLLKIYMAIAATSIIGTIIVIPTIIILQKPSKRFDQVFILLGITLINLIAFSVVMSSLLDSIMSSMLGGIMGGF